MDVSVLAGGSPGDMVGALVLAAADPHAVERRLLLVLLQLCVIITVARLMFELFRKMGQPGVVGEIIAGLLLGPSFLGAIEQAIWGAGQQPISNTLFSKEVDPILGTMKELGLVFLLFLIGLEFDFSHLKAKSKAALSISVTGVALPFVLGLLLGQWMAPHVGDVVKMAVVDGKAVQTVTPLNVTSFCLFMGTAMSITALPILGRMMMEWGVTRTRIGAVTITSAAIDDATGWILLAAVSATVATGFDPVKTVIMVGLVLAFAAAVFFVLRPIMRWAIAREMNKNSGGMSLNGMAAILVVIFLCAMATSKIGIFAIFGAFTLGAALSDLHAFRELITRNMRDFVTVLFLPIFFTYTGLRTDIGSLESAQLWLMAGAVCAAAIIGKFGGCTVAARLGGFGWRESGVIGIMMNTRALMELIVINVGWELGVIPRNVFCMLVMMAVLTTVMTTPILKPMARGTEFEPHLLRTGFLRRRT